MAYPNNGYRIAVLAALLGAGGIFAACSSDSNPQPPASNSDGGATGSSGGATGNGGSKPGGATGSGGAGTSGTSGGGASGAGTAGASGAAGAGAGGTPPDGGPACTENAATACLECPIRPQDDVEFLNHCSDATAGCIKFMGTVPATLPPIP